MFSQQVTCNSNGVALVLAAVSPGERAMSLMSLAEDKKALGVGNCLQLLVTRGKSYRCHHHQWSLVLRQRQLTRCER